MKEGNIIFTPVPQADGKMKNRPAIYLRQMPPLRDALGCGVSTQTHHLTLNFDQLITNHNSVFPSNGLVCDSAHSAGLFGGFPAEISSAASGRYRPKDTSDCYTG